MHDPTVSLCERRGRPSAPGRVTLRLVCALDGLDHRSDSGVPFEAALARQRSPREEVQRYREHCALLWAEFRAEHVVISRKIWTIPLLTDFPDQRMRFDI